MYTGLNAQETVIYAVLVGLRDLLLQPLTAHLPACVSVGVGFAVIGLAGGLWRIAPMTWGWLLLGVACNGLASADVLPLAAWLAPVCLLHVTRHAPLVSGWLALMVLLYLVNLLSMRSALPVDGPASFLILLFLTLRLMLPYLADRWLSRRLPGVAATLVFPAAYVAMEFACARLTPSATWWSLAYTQAGNPALMQLAAITGIWGITFLIAWFGSSINGIWDAGFSPDALRTGAMIYGGTLGIALLAGSARLALADTSGPSVRVAAISYPKDEMFIPGEITRIQSAKMRPDESALLRDKVARLQTWFLDSTRREARAGAKVIAWPETNLLVFRENEPAFLDRACGLARDEA
jgi:apolipoprotein N-acyltransferase